MNTRVSLVLSIFLVALLTVDVPYVQAQQPEVRCPIPRLNVDSVIAQLEAIGDGTTLLGRPTTSTAIQFSVSRPFFDETCPAFTPEVDRKEAIQQILRYAADHGDDRLGGLIMEFASATAFQRAEQIEWDPTDFLFSAIRSARTATARWQALLALVRRAEDQNVQGRLLALVRAPVGPQTWPDVAADLLFHLDFMPDPGARQLSAAIQASPHLVRHGLAAWHLRCGQAHARPRERSDPCHPANAPSRISPLPRN